MAIVKAKYFRTKIGDPNSPVEVPFLLVPQASGHSEKEIQVSEETVKGLAVGSYMEVDTQNLPYLRAVPVGSAVPGGLSDKDKDDIAARIASLMGK